jgi:hypothetical protein
MPIEIPIWAYPVAAAVAIAALAVWGFFLFRAYRTR